ncbi:MAG: restriction endonuclease [Campylobacterota bacterium]|nr:restriction endonuclease [Campylobacterota bacterium]
MTDYTTEQIQSIAILVVFFMVFSYKLSKSYRNFKNRTLLKRNKTLKKIKRLSWFEFELLTIELFVALGWKVKGNEKKGADGGIDIWIEKHRLFRKSITAIVQCKKYEDAKVTVKVVREMYGLMHEHDVDEVYIVTTSQFTKECYSFVKEKKIILIHGNILVRLIARVT